MQGRLHPDREGAGLHLRPANYDEIQWKVIPEASTRSAELIAGNVDIITNVPPDQHDAVNDSGAAEGRCRVGGTRRMYVGYQLQRKSSPIRLRPERSRRPKVRIALQYAVDVPTICQALLAYECDAPTSMVNPPNNNPNLTPYPYDPAMAEQLLDAAGYPRGEDGIRFESALMAGSGRYLNDVNVVLAIAQYLTDVGVKTNLQRWNGFRIRAAAAQQQGRPAVLRGHRRRHVERRCTTWRTSPARCGHQLHQLENPEWFDRWRSLAETRDPAAEKEHHQPDAGSHVQ